MDMMLWNGGLSLTVALILLWVKTSQDEVKRVAILLSKTREEGAEKYVTRSELHTDINRVIDRLDRLDTKLDTFIREQKYLKKAAKSLKVCTVMPDGKMMKDSEHKKPKKPTKPKKMMGGGMMKYGHGGSVDGIAQRGKTKGRMC
jgi:hypothetical protein